MRLALVFAIATLWAGTAFADEPAACYVSRDATGDFVPEKLEAYDADPRLGNQIAHKMNETSRAASKCIASFVQREGYVPPGGGGVLFGARISPAGKLTQVSVLAARNVNDGMLMACLARVICGWELEADPDGRERLVKLPPHTIGGRAGWAPSQFGRARNGTTD